MCCRVTSGEQRQPDANEADHRDPREEPLGARLRVPAGQSAARSYQGPLVPFPGADVLGFVPGAVPETRLPGDVSRTRALAF